MAQFIHDRFLSNNATEPVNVDSSGKNLTAQQLQEADLNLLQNVSISCVIFLVLLHLVLRAYDVKFGTILWWRAFHLELHRAASGKRST